MDTEGEGLDGMDGESGPDLHTRQRVRQTAGQKLLHVLNQELSAGLPDGLGMGGWGGRRRQEGGNVCLGRADLCCHTAETNITFKTITFQ